MNPRFPVTIAIPTLAVAATLLTGTDASAAESSDDAPYRGSVSTEAPNRVDAPDNAGSRFRFHGELDALSFSHFNPSGDGSSRNSFGFGLGRTTGTDMLIAPPSWALGFGYVLSGGNAIVGGRFAFNLETSDDETDEMGEAFSSRTTVVGGQFVPYFRYLFRPGERVRPFLEARIGFGGSSSTARVDTDPELRASIMEIHPTAGIGGGAHIFLINAFSVDLGVTADYAAPYMKSRLENGDTETESDYDKRGDFFNLAAQVGFSVWF